jgi:hypothetical protein
VFVSSNVEVKDYGGYYYTEQSDGSILVQLPGTHEVFTTLPNMEMFKRFVEQANGVFIAAMPALKLHLTGCKRCQKSVDSEINFFDPCRTGGPMILQGKQVAQEISRVVANEFLTWWKTEQERLQADGAGTTSDTEGVPEVRSD